MRLCGTSGLQRFADLGADHTHIGTAFELGLQLAHHLTHLLHAGGAAGLDSLVHHLLQLFLGQGFGQELAALAALMRRRDFD